MYKSDCKCFLNCVYIGLTIVNIPEQGEPDITTDAKKKITDENQNTVKDPSSTCIAAQNILNEMFSTLTPQRRTLRSEFDASSLSVRARSISPEPRRPQASPAYQPESRDLRLGPSPTPVHSRPTSARRSNKENIPPANFSVKHFSHFCFDDDVRILLCSLLTSIKFFQMTSDWLSYG